MDHLNNEEWQKWIDWMEANQIKLDRLVGIG